MNNFIESQNILSENQAGFRKDHSTIDHIFTLNSLIQILKHYNKKLFCVFIDFSKAFDSVWHIGLWQKLLKHNINGKFFNIVRNMYMNMKSCVSVDGTTSNLFSCNCGVRQGENLSPILFALFLNDLEDYLYNQQSNGLNLNDANVDPSIYLKLILLLYADDKFCLQTIQKIFNLALTIS